jgi:hypothetical protein
MQGKRGTCEYSTSIRDKDDKKEDRLCQVQHTDEPCGHTGY